MRRVTRFGFVAAALFLGSTHSAHAQEQSAYDKLAIQKRKYQLANELRFSVGALPADPYRKGFSVTLAYTRHLNDFLAWEIVSVSGAILTRTDLTDELVEVFGAQPTSSEFAAPRFIATTGVEFTPLYGKWSFLNGRQVNHAFSVGGHAGVIFGNRTTEEEPSLDEIDIGRTLTDIRPSVGPALAYRLYFNQNWSARIDTRLFASFRPPFEDGDDFQVDAVLLINLGISYNFGADI
ncbi:MAG: hypothetical protein ACFB9M_19760 [Myxococcota bacterium]